jgi:ABC-2 type transport system ATP-binding protein
MIDVNNLTKYFGAVLAVDHVTFHVNKGEIVGFLGPNGAGKTTTMRILTTYLPATSGTASVAGFDVMQESYQVRQNLGYLPESVPLYPDMRVDEYLEYRAQLKAVPRLIRRQRLDYCIDRCRLTGVRRRLLGTLSRGYRQRVGLAEALISDPAILILDEPTSGLDPNQQQETLGLIRELREKHTIILSTHILTEVEAVCERVIIISQGQIVLQDNLENLRKGAVIQIEVRGPRAEVQAALQAIQRVTQVKDLTPEGHEDGLAGFEIQTAEDADLREELAERISRQGWRLRRLDLRRHTLQEHFVNVTLGRTRQRETATAAE